MRPILWPVAVLPLCLAVYGYSQNNIGPSFTSLVVPTILASNGGLYGLTDGGLFSLNLNSGVYTLYSTASNVSQLCFEGGDGNLYGLDAQNDFVKISLTGTVAVVSSAIGAVCPVMANDGNYYGGNATGGEYSHGELYRMTPAGEVSVIYNFSGTFDGNGPSLSLVQGSDGNLYGFGSVGFFRYSSSEGLTNLGGQEGTTPPLEGSDGNFYSLIGSNQVLQVMPTGQAAVIFTANPPSGGSYTTGTLSQIYMYGAQDIDVVETDDYVEPCGGNTLSLNSIDLKGDTAGSKLLIGTFYPYSPFQPDTVVTASMFPGGNGLYYGGYFEQVTYIDSGGFCETPIETYSMFDEATNTADPPIEMNLSATHVRTGGTATLTYQVNNAFSGTMQQCYGYGGLSGKLGLSGSATVTAPTAGSYTPAIVCGGTETALAPTLVAGDAMLVISPNASVKRGAEVTLVAQITNAGIPMPTGSIKFTYGSLVLASVPLNGSTTASFKGSTSGLAAGTYDVVAAYAGDANYGPGSAMVAITVLPTLATSTVITPASQTVNNVNGTGAFTATVTGGVAGILRRGQ